MIEARICLQAVEVEAQPVGVVPAVFPVDWEAIGAIHFELGPFAIHGPMGNPSLTTLAAGPGRPGSALSTSK